MECAHGVNDRGVGAADESSGRHEVAPHALREAMRMTEAEAAIGPEGSSGGRFHLRQIVKIVAIVVGLGAAASALGWDIDDWFSDLWDVLTQISIGYVVAGV